MHSSNHKLFSSKKSLGAKLKVVIASESQIKVDSVKQAIEFFFTDDNIQFEFVGVATISGVGEQPFNAETELGAGNRLVHAEKLMPNANLYIAIENGLFERDKRYFDKAILKFKKSNGQEQTFESDEVEFPAQYVEEARKIGFDKVTVGYCMQKAGLIKNAKDPHADLGAKIPRAVILTTAVYEATMSLACTPVARNSI